MLFDQAEAGDYRIYAGAIEVPPSGYRTVLVIKRVRGIKPAREVYRNEDLAGGFAWPNAREALQYAMQVGQRLVSDGRLTMRG